MRWGAEEQSGVGKCLKKKRKEEIHDRFAVRAVSPRNPRQKLTINRRPAEDGLDERFARIKQMNGVSNDNYWSKRPTWKQPKYDCDRKSHKA